MKKFINILFSIILILCCTYIISNANELFDPIEDKVRNVTAVQNFTGNAASEVEHWFFNHLINRADLMCAQHGTIFFSEEDTVIKISGNVGDKGFEETVYNGSPIDGSWGPEEFKVYSGNPGDSASVSLTLSTSSYSGKDRKNDLGIDDDDSLVEAYIDGIKNIATLETTGTTVFKRIKSGSPKNTALAYILSECQNNAGIMPRQSYVNIAFWQWQIDGDVASDKIDISNVLDGYMQDTDEILNSLYKTKDELIKPIKKKRRLIKSLKATISELKKEKERLEEKLETSSDKEAIKQEIEIAKKNIEKYEKELNKLEKEIEPTEEKIRNINIQIKQRLNVLIQEYYDSANGLWEEAKDFQAMWNDINKLPNKSYANSIEDKTNKDNISVQYNSEENCYVVGPFNISYLERYTGIVTDKKNNNKITEAVQLCGMTGTPELVVSKDGEKINLTYGKDWQFQFDENTNTARKIAYYEKYNYYPHSKEDFYIKLNYIKGLDKILSIKFGFRYMTAEAEYEIYEGDIQIVTWSAYLEEDECPGGVKCSEGSEHTSPKTHTHSSYRDTEKRNDCDTGSFFRL